ncbi:hypothetical protein [Paraburkholderia sp. J10-1]|uniref:hypothetical protein n=1 Tax=Paraburkholderia sp. J10-1 TaxID=2805430 RepID=UPI002AB6DE5A|nr:hypothetical protein [Paraburkholderia sp. J10-1]
MTTNTQSGISNTQVPFAQFAEELGMTYGVAPHWFVQAKARNATVPWYYPTIGPRALLSLTYFDEKFIRDMPRYREFLEEFAVPEFGRNTEFGRITFEETCDQEGSLAFTFAFCPRSLARNPTLRDPVFDPATQKFCAVHTEAVAEFRSLIEQRYRGSADLCVLEGNEIHEALTVRISVEAGSPVNYTELAKDLVDVCDSPEFDRRFLRVVRRAAARRNELIRR